MQQCRQLPPWRACTAAKHSSSVPHPICRPGRRCSFVATRQSVLQAAGLHAAGPLRCTCAAPRVNGSGDGQPAGAAAAGAWAAAGTAAASTAAAPPSTCAAQDAPDPGCCCRRLLLPHKLYSSRGCGGCCVAGMGGSAAGGASSRDRSHTCTQTGRQDAGHLLSMQVDCKLPTQRRPVLAPITQA